MALSLQEGELKRDLADRRLLVGNRAERLLEAARLFRERVRIGYEAINLKADTPELEAAQFKARKKIIEAIVQRVEVLEDKSIRIYTDFALPEEISISPTGWRSG